MFVCWFTSLTCIDAISISTLWKNLSFYDCHTWTLMHLSCHVRDIEKSVVITSWPTKRIPRPLSQRTLSTCTVCFLDITSESEMTLPSFPHCLCQLHYYGLLQCFPAEMLLNITYLLKIEHESRFKFCFILQRLQLLQQHYRRPFSLCRARYTLLFLCIT